MMKKFFRPAVILGISLLIAIFAAGFTYTAKISGLESSTRAAIFLQATSTPGVEEDLSEIGSKDGIVIMGGVIVLIVLLPILIKRKSWMQTE